MGKANAFTAPITVVNYDEQALNNTEARTLVDAVAKKDASVWQFGGESNTLTGLYFRGYQLDARQSGTARLTDQYFRTLSMNLTARGEFETGPVTHNWSTAFDRVIRQRKTIRGTAAGAGKVEVKANGNIEHQLASFKADYPNSWENSAYLDANIKVNSLALSDTLGFVDNKYRLTLGGRFQAVEYTDKKKSQSGDAKRFSPMLMAAWVSQPDLVVYGNYMEDLERADIKTDDSGETTMAKPRVSRQFEVGVRKNWGNFVTTLNAFQIKRPGYWRGHTTTKTTKGGNNNADLWQQFRFRTL